MSYNLGATEFLGYETNQAEGVVLSLLSDNKEVGELKENDEGMIIVNQTPFYGESGGQVGDTGEIISNNFKFEVTDVQKKLGDLFVHYGKVISGSIKINDSVELKIDIKRRDDTRAYHSATHLLHESLRRVLGDHVTQKGSLVEPSRLRFDFSHMKPIPTLSSLLAKTITTPSFNSFFPLSTSFLNSLGGNPSTF